MIERNTILEELRSLNSQLTFPPENLYKVPEGYFEGLADRIMVRINSEDDANKEIAELSPLLNSLSRQMPYSVPDGYFKPADPASQKEEEISSLLHDLREKHTYSVPEKYFEQLPSVLLEKVKVNTARVVPFSQRKWMRYAAAAVITGIIAGILIFKNGDSIDPDRSSMVWIEKNTKKVSKEEINSLISLAITDSTNTIVKSTTKDDIKNLVKDIPEKEIQDLLNDASIEELGAEDELFLN